MESSQTWVTVSLWKVNYNNGNGFRAWLKTINHLGTVYTQVCCNWGVLVPSQLPVKSQVTQFGTEERKRWKWFCKKLPRPVICVLLLLLITEFWQVFQITQKPAKPVNQSRVKVHTYQSELVLGCDPTLQGWCSHDNGICAASCVGLQ